MAIVALCAAVCGVWARLACFIAGLLLYHLAPLETIMWTPNPFERGFTISVLALLTLSFSRCADALSMRPRHPSKTPPEQASEYNWPLRLVQLFLCQVYFFAGYSKLFRAGWSWATAENMRAWLLLISQQDQVVVFNTLGPWLADRPLFCLSIAIGALGLDLGFIGVLFWKRARFWLVSLALLFHLGILLSMNIAFLNIPQMLIFVDWQAVAHCWSNAKRHRSRAVNAAP
jgi:hypothetical protein